MSAPISRGSSDSDEFASAESETEVEANNSNVESLATSPRGQKMCDGDTVFHTEEEKNSSSQPSGVNVDTESSEVENAETVMEPPQEKQEIAGDTSKSEIVCKSETLNTPATLVEDPKPSQEKELPAAEEKETKELAKNGSGKSSGDGGVEEVAQDKVSGGGGGGWGTWGGWGSSLWSSVSSVAESAQVIGQKVTSVIASVEDTLGVPSPDEMAEAGEEPDEETRRLAESIVEHDVTEDDEVVKEEPQQPEFSPANSDYLEDDSPPQVANSDGEGAVSTMSNFFSGFAAAVQTTGQGLVSGGLDALETLGKKTMEVLSEGDPGLARKKAMLGMGASPSLSQLLMEAKAEGSARVAEQERGEAESTAATLNYSRLFEEYHGVGHLEALELLSKECAAKSRAVGSELSDASVQCLQEQLEELSQAFIFEDDETNLEDDSCKLLEVKTLLSSTSLPIKSDKLLNVSTGWREKIHTVLHQPKEEIQDSEAAGKDINSDKEEGDKDESSEITTGERKETNKEALCTELYGNGLRSLAELTSASIELFRKMAEVSLIPEAVSGDPLALSKILNKITTMILNELDSLASVHAEAITNLDVDGTNSNVTSLYLESSNSGSYVQDAFQLLQPVLKVILTQQLIVHQPHPEIIHRT